jgi:NADPH:quinone reductase
MTSAVVVERFGGPEVLVVREVAAPVPGPGEVVVDVHAAGVNFPDLLVVRELGAGVTGAGGGVGSAAVQLAKALGAHVVAAVREGSRAADDLGADDVLAVDPARLRDRSGS